MFKKKKKPNLKTGRQKAGLDFLSSGRKISHNHEELPPEEAKTKATQSCLLSAENAAITVSSDDNFYLEVQIQ